MESTGICGSSPQLRVTGVVLYSVRLRRECKQGLIYKLHGSLAAAINFLPISRLRLDLWGKTESRKQDVP